jgi:hypothetical protein
VQYPIQVDIKHEPPEHPESYTYWPTYTRIYIHVMAEAKSVTNIGVAFQADLPQFSSSFCEDDSPPAYASQIWEANRLPQASVAQFVLQAGMHVPQPQALLTLHRCSYKISKATDLVAEMALGKLEATGENDCSLLCNKMDSPSFNMRMRIEDALKENNGSVDAVKVSFVSGFLLLSRTLCTGLRRYGCENYRYR